MGGQVSLAPHRTEMPVYFLIPLHALIFHQPGTFREEQTGRGGEYPYNTQSSDVPGAQASTEALVPGRFQVI